MTSLPTLQIESVDLTRLQAFATAMIHRLPSNVVIGLVGTLGAGKTTLVQAIARAAEIDVTDVTSPTFTLLQSHRGRMTLHHLDAYRVADEDEFLELGVDELFDQHDAWTLVEWADRVADVLPRETLWIRLDLSDDGDDRVLRLQSASAEITRCCQQISDDLT